MNKDSKISRILNSVKRFDLNVLFIFAAYAIARLFLSFRAYWIWGDEAKYLACAKSFPFNRMFNHSYYDFHPVFYPYMIRFFTIFFQDHIAAIAASFFASIVLFFTVYRLFLFLNLKKRLTYIALTFMAFNHVLLSFSNIPFRYELFVSMFFLSFYFYLKGITNRKLKDLGLSALFGGITFLTSDLMPFVLLPALFGAFFIFGFNAKDKIKLQIKKLSPIFLIVLIYLTCVILPKFVIYSKNTYYAGGMEGRIEKVSEFGIKQLIHPVYFPNSFAIWGKMQMSVDLRYAKIMDKISSVIELNKFHKSRLNRYILFFIILPIAIMLLEMIFKARLIFKDKSKFIKAFKKYKQDLYLFIIIIVILYPVIYSGFISRNSIAAVPLLAYFFAKGVGLLLSIEKINRIANKRVVKNLAILTVVILTLFVIKGRHFVFTTARIEACDKVGAVLDGLPKDGVLSEGLLADALVYNTKKRVVTLPRSPDPSAAKEQTDLSISAFNLNYVLLSEFWKIELPILAYPAVEYIMDNPQKFKLIQTVYERYDQEGVSSNILRNDDTFYIYEVIRQE